MPGNLYWFVGQSSDSTIKVISYSFQSRIAILNDNGNIKFLPLKSGMSGANRESVGIGSLFKPAYKQTVTTCLTMIGRIAIVEQYIFVLCEEFIEDYECDGTDVRVVRRTYIINLGDGELIGVTTANGIFLKEANTIEYATFCSEFVTTPCLFYFVGRLGIDAFKRQLYHKNTTLTSLSLNSASSSFFHSCLC